MIRALHEEHEFSDASSLICWEETSGSKKIWSISFFNSSEKRLARTLLLASFGAAGEPQKALPNVSHETLAEMIGTTRSRVNFFMNRFRKLGFIQYNGEIHINNSLRSVVRDD